ncbi:hypothetical protein AVEN_205432-1 [Araneus ventricosus]|uniref:Peptidase A2 domain-containing protein n=1 Tax=Araneus ventricosus TaxID=182803 RepID=A0A4Y2C6C5_ARAVE|nr:hypothetical protein AVEN_193677-1 [Araneus ventricosus]GBL99881.1 hypothetical protein AVEN_120664-1 [Araneus ventricosus]GBL99898.1 hypothetical protein AVEN_141415-1 [Araneus ventricosus]GBL99917.1 hypothetical protein AVEN_205432-1 [Araneus ventricosus]
MELRARIDTGADKSLLSYDHVTILIEKGQVKLSHQSTNLCGVSGEIIHCIGQLTGVIEWKGIRREHTFVVVEGLPVPMLIGVDLLQTWEVVVDFRRWETLTGTPSRQGEIDWDKMQELTRQSDVNKNQLLENFHSMPELFCS